MKHLWVTLWLLVAGCIAPAPEPGFEILTAEAEPLRAAFNAAQGKVRAIFLASPS